MTTRKKPAAAKVPANAEKLAPATTAAASGAIVEPAILDRIDMGHPSVDDAPRERSTAEMNQLDLNQPSGRMSQEDMVAANLREQGA